MLALALSLAACGGAPPEATFDHAHAAFGEVLAGAVTEDGHVRYDLVRQREARLDAYVDSLKTAPIATFDEAQQLALWVNAYNAITLSIVADNPGIASIRDLDGGEVWKTRTFEVAGQTVSLDQIEHERARKLADGRVHAVLNCASKGCPPMPPTPFVGTQVDAQLDAAARRWVATNAFEQRGQTVYLSEIFKWFPGDFERFRKDAIPGANEAQTRGLWFVATYAGRNEAERLTIGALSVAWQPYDWSLNGAAP